MTISTTTTGPGTGPGELLAAALTYAARGWHVIPLTPGTKRPAFPDHTAETCTGTDPRCRAARTHLGWEARATTDPDRITRAWTGPVPYGIGIACGPSGLVVIDCDVAKPGAVPPPPWQGTGITRGTQVLAALAETLDEHIPATYTVTTPSGGTHHYYAHPAGPGGRLGNTAGSLGWLLDTRGRGGQVVASPSATGGSAYTVIDDRPPVVLPGWLATRLRPATDPLRQHLSAPVRTGDRSQAYLRAALDAETARVRDAAPGGRNHALFLASLALGQLVAGGELDADHVRAVLLDAATTHLTAGAYTHAQAEATITSGLRRGATRPRRLSEAA